jgi:hypothetical protein
MVDLFGTELVFCCLQCQISWVTQAVVFDTPKPVFFCVKVSLIAERNLYLNIQVMRLIEVYRVLNLLRCEGSKCYIARSGFVYKGFVRKPWSKRW